MLRNPLVAFLFALSCIGAAFAAQPGEETTATKAFMGAMSKMNEDMPKDHTGNPDVDFVSSCFGDG